jgi:hypothetical protein
MSRSNENKQGKPTNPIDIALLGSDRIAFYAKMPADTIEQFRRSRGGPSGSEHWLGEEAVSISKWYWEEQAYFNGYGNREAGASRAKIPQTEIGKEVFG